MEELIKKANELGVKDAQSFKEKDLKALVNKLEKEVKIRLDLLEKFKENDIDIDGLESYSTDDLITAWKEREQEMLDQDELNQKINLLTEYLGFDYQLITLEELRDSLSQKEFVAKEMVQEVVCEKFKAPFKVFGREYVFCETAPEYFRFADVVKSQQQWVKDKDSMEMMVSGEVSFIKNHFKQ